MGQFGLVGVAAAQRSHNSQPAASASPTPAPSDSPTPAPSASPSPDPSASPTPTPTPTPSASPDPAAGSSSSDGSDAGSGSKHKSQDASNSTTGAPATTGAQGCGGSAPSWVFNTSTQTWQAADTASFTCDKASGYYLSPEYYYNQQDGWYEIIPPAQAAALPSYYLTTPGVVHTALGDLVVGSPDYQMAQSLGLLNDTGGILLSNTGSGSTNQAGITNNAQNWVDLTSLVNVINTLQSNANSGNVSATANTQVGSAQTGAATVVANLINLLAAAWSWSNGDLNVFTQTICQINQTCNGDVNLNPGSSASGSGGQLGTGSASVNGTGANSSNQAGISNTSGVNVNAQSSGNIVNNVNLDAQSGNASANSNTVAGDVVSGNALAEVNIMNLINSFINSGSSFFGVLNIFGTLNGNILFPNGFLDSAVPSGTGAGNSAAIGSTGPGSNNQVGVDNSNQANINNTVANSVANNVTTTAASGAATADSNTSAGNVGTGAVNTTQGLFNLANSSIFGDNAVLVIVNVAGHWIGKLMNIAGTGSTQSALLTGGATVSANNTGAGSNNQANVSNNSTANVNSQAVGTITNNVNVNAKSGTASASDNTQVGNVTSGNAEADSSVANIFNSVLNVKHWFGVLVINVVGSWFGDVGVAAPDGSAGSSSTGSTVNGGTTIGSGTSTPALGLLALLPDDSGTTSASGTSSNGGNTVTNSDAGIGSDQALTAVVKQPAQESAVSIDKGRDMSLLFGLSALVLMIAGALFSIDKKLKRR